MITYDIDLSQYTAQEVSTFLANGIITREEYDQWKQLQQNNQQLAAA